MKRRSRHAPHPVCSYDEALQELLPNIRAHAFKNQIPGLDTDDVVSEMTIVLWRSWMTWDPDNAQEVPLAQWFWVRWSARKKDLIRYYFRARRATYYEVPLSEQEVDALAPLVTRSDFGLPECPVEDATARRVWVLLGMGFRPNEVAAVLQISKRAYYAAIDLLRNDDVAYALA